MARINQTQAFESFITALRSGGAFLVAGKENPNFMTIGWGNPGVIWGKDILVVQVRLSRHTHDKMEEHKEFTVCVPRKGELKKELAFAGSKSGREFDKLKELGLSFAPCETVAVPRIAECEYVYECKTVYQTEMHEAKLDPDIVKKCYREGDYHTLYFGEILACHKF